MDDHPENLTDRGPLAPLTPEMQEPVRTDAELHRRWRRLWGTPGTGVRALWLMVLDADDRVVPLLPCLEDLPPRPAPEDVERIGWFARELLSMTDGASIAFLLGRPGGRRPTPDDRMWGRTLLAAAERVGAPCRPVHVAGDEDVVVLAADDLCLPEAG